MNSATAKKLWNNRIGLEHSLDKVVKILDRMQRQRDAFLTHSDRYHDDWEKLDIAVEELRKRIDYHCAVALRVDNWLPACNGTETPFDTRTGRKLLYCWNPATEKHGYIDCGTDMLLTDEEAQIALGV